MHSNPFGYRDENAKRLSVVWQPLRVTATAKQKNAVGMAFISCVLNLGDNVAQAFAQGDSTAKHQVGMRQGNADPYLPDLETFWKEMQGIFRDLHTPGDISFLVKKCGTLGALHFLFHLDSYFLAPCQGAWSEVLSDLSCNAAAYK